MLPLVSQVLTPLTPFARAVFEIGVGVLTDLESACAGAEREQPEAEDGGDVHG